MVILVISTLSLFHPTVRLRRQEEKTESRCFGTLTTESTSTPLKPVTLSMRSSSRQTGTGCVPQRQAASRSSTWRASAFSRKSGRHVWDF